jgi:small-conductance mechanosensitive channel
MTDPANDNANVQDLQKKRELSDAAKELLENKAFLQAIIELRKRWYDQILALPKGDERDELIAMSKTLDTLAPALGVLMNNYRMGLRQQQRHG